MTRTELVTCLHHAATVGACSKELLNEAAEAIEALDTANQYAHAHAQEACRRFALDEGDGEPGTAALVDLLAGEIERLRRASFTVLQVRDKPHDWHELVGPAGRMPPLPYGDSIG